LYVGGGQWAPYDRYFSYPAKILEKGFPTWPDNRGCTVFTILYIFFSKYLISQTFLLTYITTFEPETPAGHPKYQKTQIVA